MQPRIDVTGFAVDVTSQPANDRLKVYAWAEFVKLPPSEHLVKGVLDRGAFSVVFGEPNTGKSFFAMDLALHVALGWEWRGKKVRPGAVVYIAAEGGRGLIRRLDAFGQHHQIDDPAGLPFYILPAPLDLRDGDGDTGPLIKKIEALGASQRVELVVVDTLARTFGGGNENAPDDMGAFVANMDRIRQQTGAHVLIVHHSGKDAAKGGRGHSSLRGALETEIEVKAGDDGRKTAEIVKQRDGERGAVFGFTLEVVEVGTDDEGDPITSCVVVPSEAAPAHRHSRLTGQNRIALEKLHDLIAREGKVPPGSSVIPAGVRAVSLEHWRQHMERVGPLTQENQDSRYKAWNRICTRLQSAGEIGIGDGYVWPVSQQLAHAA